MRLFKLLFILFISILPLFAAAPVPIISISPLTQNIEEGSATASVTINVANCNKVTQDITIDYNLTIGTDTPNFIGTQTIYPSGCLTSYPIDVVLPDPLSSGNIFTVTVIANSAQSFSYGNRTSTGIIIPPPSNTPAISISPVTKNISIETSTVNLNVIADKCPNNEDINVTWVNVLNPDNNGTKTFLKDVYDNCNKSIPITVIVPSGLDINDTFDVNITATSTGLQELGAVNPDTARITILATVSDLNISKTASAGPIFVGTDFTYTIYIENGGESDTDGNITVIDNIPYGIIVTGWTGTNWTCSQIGLTLTCINSTGIAHNGNSTIQINATAPSYGGNFTNIATVYSGNDSDILNNTDDAPTTIINTNSAADLCYIDSTGVGAKCEVLNGLYYAKGTPYTCEASATVRNNNLTEILEDVNVSKLYNPNKTGGNCLGSSYCSTVQPSPITGYNGGYSYNLGSINSDANKTISDTNTYYSGDLTDIILYGTYEKDNLIYSGKIYPCSGSSGTYPPIHADFKVLNEHYYPYENLPTQITSRADNFRVLAIDLSTGAPKDLNTSVDVELVDASSSGVCENKVSIGTEKITLLFENNNSAIFDGAYIRTWNNLSVNDPRKIIFDRIFYEKATKRAAFRITYSSINGNGLVKLTGDDSSGYHLEDFTSYAGQPCHTPFIGPMYSHDGTELTDHHPYNMVPDACANSGLANASAMSHEQLNMCLKCINGGDVISICPQEEFAIRPEAFMIKLKDQNQTVPTNQPILDDTISGVTSPSGNVLNVASGYNYNIEVNATNYYTTTSSPEYNTSDNLAKLIWEPSSSVTCNDENNYTTPLIFTSGSLDTDTNLSNNQVGEYRLNITDTTWTVVDSNTTGRTGNFLGGADCTNNAATVAVGSGINGCNISSDHNSTSGSGLKYRDYNVTFHPYKFDLNMTGLSATGLPRAMTPSVGLTPSPITPTSYIYMADMSKDQNMSYHLNGYIRASGYNDSNLSNFVGECYGKPIDINITKAIDVNNTLAYQYRFNTLNVNDINISTTSGDLNNTTGPVQIFLSEGNFTDLNGSINSNLNLNFFREVNSSMNPRVVTFHTYSVDCQNADVNCTFKADLTTKTTNGTLDLDHNVSHIYGRTHAPRYRFKGPDGNATIYYESHCNGTDIHGVACNKVFLPNGAFSKSTNDPRWFQNISHAQATYGVAGNINQKGYPFDAGHVNTISPGGVVTETTGKAVAALHYNAAATIGYPYRTTMENNASNWLIYNKYDANDTKNEFPVEFWKTGGKWAGKRETNTTTHSKGTERTNRRSMW